MFNDRRKLPALNATVQTYGLDLPGVSKQRSMKDFNARASVIAAARSGSIKAASKSKKKGK